MPWERPTLATLIKRNQADIEAEISGVDAKVRRRNLNILAKVVSLVSHTLYGFIAYLAKQIIASSSEGEYLERHASFYLPGGRKGASFSTGFAVFEGTPGAVIDENTNLIRSDGIEYQVDESGIFSGTSLTLPISALVAGQAGNAEAGTKLSLSQPIDGVTSTALADVGGISGGADVEDDESVIDRITERVQNPPHGGASNDYVKWAKEVPGVTRAWVYPKELGAGTVTVRFVRDDDANILPDIGEVATVQVYIDEHAPVTADVAVVAPLAAPLNFDISLTPNSPAVRAAVMLELEDLIIRESIPAGKLPISHIREAISLAAGETDHVLNSPTADVIQPTGYMTVMGVITWS